MISIIERIENIEAKLIILESALNKQDNDDFKYSKIIKHNDIDEIKKVIGM